MCAGVPKEHNLGVLVLEVVTSALLHFLGTFASPARWVNTLYIYILCMMDRKVYGAS